ncbi:MAG: hypothetical protein HN849_23015 [Victivallales bacterium]|nr:hypothetical protein [Victivallales bacterium]
MILRAPLTSSLRSLSILLAALSLPLAMAADGDVALAKADFFLSPSGDDGNGGTQNQPFRTLARARDAVRELRAKGRNGDVTVMVRGGTYPFAATAVFGLADSAPKGSATRFVAFPGETPLFSGSMPVTGWRRLEAIPDRLPAKARDKVWVADVRGILARKVPQEPSIPPAPVKPVSGELLLNGSFVQGRKGWEVYAADAAQEKLDVTFEPAAKGQAARLHVVAGRASHRLQLRQNVNVAKGQEYVWGFTMSADAPTKVPVLLLQQSPPHQNVVHQDVEVGPKAKRFVLRGIAPADLDCVASFQIGGNVGRTIRIADVSLIGPKRGNRYTQRPHHETAGRFFSLFEGGERLPRARSKGFRQTNSASGWHGAPHDELQFPEGMLRDGPDVTDAEIRVIPRAQWVQNILPLVSVDEVKKVAKLRYPATYAMAYCGAGHTSTVWVENRLEHLDSPGEWVLDSRAKRLYLWPRTDEPQDIAAPVLTELIRIEGKIDYPGPTDMPVRGLEFHGITFSQAERHSWHGLTGWGVQHDWEAFDAPSGMVRLRGAEDCVFQDCQFVNSGSTGLRLDLHAQRNRVQGCQFAHLGGVGVFLCGYGPGAKDVNRENEIVDNYIHHIGETYWASPGIFAWQSGSNRIAHNTLHDTPYTAVVVTARAGLAPTPSTRECSASIRNHEIKDEQRGNWWQREPLLHGRLNIVEYNDIFRVMRILGDGNGIYVSGAGKENRVQYNYVHDCPSKHMAEGIRCDDDQHETIMHGNVVWGMGGHATGITIKGRNTITNNIIGAPCVARTARGFISLELGSMKGTVVKKNVLYATRRGHSFFYQRRLYGSGAAPRLRDAEADGNLYWCAENAERARTFVRAEQANGVEKQSRVADPLLMAPAKGDFRFKPGSPALAMGIEPLDMSKAGLRAPYRQRYIKPPLRTTISPVGGVLRKPIQITLAASEPVAAIRYTVNGTLPTMRSTPYAGPFLLREPCELRARSFKDGFADGSGASALFAPPPDPLRLDLAGCKPGDLSPMGKTHEEEGKEATIRVAADETTPAFLRFLDRPGQKYDFNPHLSIPFKMKAGRLVGRITVRVDKDTHLYYQWRRHNIPPLQPGPTFYIRPGGKLCLTNGRELMRVPLGQWATFEVTGTLGVAPASPFTLRVHLPGEEKPREFRDLPAPGAGFRAMDSLFIVAQGVAKAQFDVKDIELVPAD